MLSAAPPECSCGVVTGACRPLPQLRPHGVRLQIRLIRLVPSRRLYLQADDPAVHSVYAASINRDHLAIYAGIEARDTARARKAARAHMQKSYERYSGLTARLGDD